MMSPLACSALLRAAVLAAVLPIAACGDAGVLEPHGPIAAAERLPGMMPAAGHLEHMPAHIMQRVGRYADAATANRKGADADVAYFAKTTPPDYYVMYTAHNYQFLSAAAVMGGRSEESIRAARDMVLNTDPDMLKQMPELDAILAAQPPQPRVRSGGGAASDAGLPYQPGPDRAAGVVGVAQPAVERGQHVHPGRGVHRLGRLQRPQVLPPKSASLEADRLTVER